jgi:glycerophosphoryl diester phosphodiesterase
MKSLCFQVSEAVEGTPVQGMPSLDVEASFLQKTIRTALLAGISGAVILSAALAGEKASADEPDATAQIAETSSSSDSDQKCARAGMVIMGHRGIGMGTKMIDGKKVTEDTIPAFQAAVRHGADGFETDIWFTKDGKPVHNHDPRLERTSNGKGYIADRPYSYIKKLRTDSGAKIPTHTQVLETMRNAHGLQQQEFKMKEPQEDQIRLVIKQDYKYIQGIHTNLLITSGDADTVEMVNAIDPTIQTGLIARGHNYQVPLNKVPEGTDVILLDIGAVDKQYVSDALESGYQVSLRGIDTVQMLHKAARLGVTRVVTDEPVNIGNAC